MALLEFALNCFGWRGGWLRLNSSGSSLFFFLLYSTIFRSFIFQAILLLVKCLSRSHSMRKAGKTTIFKSIFVNRLVAVNILVSCFLELKLSYASFIDFNICFLFTFRLCPQKLLHKLCNKSIFALSFFFCLLFAKFRIFVIFNDFVLFSTLCMTTIAHSFLYFLLWLRRLN